MHANIVIGLLLVAVFSHAALSLRLMRLGTRVGRVEAKELELLRTIAAAQEIGALRGAVTVKPAHRFAGPMLCEAMALWHDQRGHAVVSAKSEEILFALG